MKKVIYSKFSNDRAEQFSIRTDILMGEDGTRIIRKSPAAEDARMHIQNMKRWERELKAIYQGTLLQINTCSLEEGYAEFEYIEGDTLEEVLQNLLQERKIQQAEELLDSYLKLILEKNTQFAFRMTDRFQEVFGLTEENTDWRCGSVTNIDMITENILLNQKWNVIDYEWTFDFPVPVSFVLFRILFYLGNGGKKEKSFVEPFYTKYGITEEEQDKFLVMEKNFQKFMVGTHEPVHELYGSMGQEIYQVHTMIHNYEINQDKGTIQVFFDRGSGFTEEDSYFEKQSGMVRNCSVVIDSGIKAVRIDPAIGCCQVNIQKFLLNDKQAIENYTANGYLCGKKSIIFDTDDPQILWQNTDKISGKISICFSVEFLNMEEAGQRISVFRLKDEEVAKMQRLHDLEVQQKAAVQASYDDLKNHYEAAIQQRDQLNQELQSLLNSTSWKLTAPMRKAGNLRKKKQAGAERQKKSWVTVVHCAGKTREEAKATIDSLPEGSKAVLYLRAEKFENAEKFKGHGKKRLIYVKENPNGSYGRALYEELKSLEAEYFWMMEAGSLWLDETEHLSEESFAQNNEFVYGDSMINGIPCHKPEYNPDYLTGFNYIGTSWAVKKDLYLKFAGECPSYAYWNYRCVLFFTGNAGRVSRIPRIMFREKYGEKKRSWEWELIALKDDLYERQIQAEAEKGRAYGTFRLRYSLKNEPFLSIIIPNMNHREDLKRCLDSIKRKTTYQNYEIIIVENNSTESDIFAYYEELKEWDKITVITWEGEFNYSAINNYGVSHAKGEYYLLLNNDVEVITPGWLEEMLMYGQRNDVGAVGAMLYYPNDTVQHAGVILGIGGVAGHSQKHFAKGDTGYYNRLCVPQDLTAVTAACVLVRASVYREVQGLDEEYKVAFNDVDFCMKIRKAGYRIVFTPFAELYHYESISRGDEDTPEKVQRFGNEVVRFQTKWSTELSMGDPYYNPNLSLEKDDFSLAGQ